MNIFCRQGIVMNQQRLEIVHSTMDAGNSWWQRDITGLAEMIEVLTSRRKIEEVQPKAKQRVRSPFKTSKMRERVQWMSPFVWWTGGCAVSSDKLIITGDFDENFHLCQLFSLFCIFSVKGAKRPSSSWLFMQRLFGLRLMMSYFDSIVSCIRFWLLQGFFYFQNEKKLGWNVCFAFFSFVIKW